MRLNDWLPIETAPKDERDILGWCAYTTGDFYAESIFWGSTTGTWVTTVEMEEAFPTHWMPLPPPPSDSDTQPEAGDA